MLFLDMPVEKVDHREKKEKHREVVQVKTEIGAAYEKNHGKYGNGNVCKLCHFVQVDRYF